jgi:acyl-CoA hydrolase
MLDGRAISSVGGAADFARAASFSADGISIIALPATSGSSDLPRIVPRLDGICSLPRQDVDVVITEHGAADLRGLSVFERGTALIAVAAPQHRPALEAAFSDIIRIL